MFKETTRLTVCPFDWVEQMNKEDENDPSWRTQLDNYKKEWQKEWDDKSFPSKILESTWRNVKSYVEPLYPWRIKQAIKWWFQRRIRGFDDQSMWGLDYSLAKIIYPRLKVFYQRAQNPNIMSGYPIDCDPCYPEECKRDHDPDAGYKEWLKILRDMIYAFESVILEEEYFKYNAYKQTDWIKFQRGLNYFSTYYRNLWE
jgi:hypothetical protein